MRRMNHKKTILDAKLSLGFSTLLFSIQLGLLVKLYYQSPLALLIAGCLKLSIALMIMKFELCIWNTECSIFLFIFK